MRLSVVYRMSVNGVNLSSVPSNSFNDDVLEADRYRFLFKVEEARRNFWGDSWCVLQLS